MKQGLIISVMQATEEVCKNLWAYHLDYLDITNKKEETEVSINSSSEYMSIRAAFEAGLRKAEELGFKL